VSFYSFDQFLYGVSWACGLGTAEDRIGRGNSVKPCIRPTN